MTTWIFMAFLICLPSAFGNLESLLRGPNMFRCCGIIRLPHPRLGEVKPPILPYSRVNRNPSPLPEYVDPDEYNRYLHFKPPSFQHKYLFTNRLSKFHQNGDQPTAIHSKSQLFGNGQNDEDFHVDLEQLLKSINSKPHSIISGNSVSENDDESPTFTPYIGARALSNMKEFFEHLQENVEALTKNEDGSTEEINPETGKAFPNTMFFRSSEWKPVASGDLGLKKIRSFIQTQENRSRLGTNLGLGKRRRR